jgi:two-component sensor histidine kinase/ligand-binding sensor domain-containing protein
MRFIPIILLLVSLNINGQNNSAIYIGESKWKYANTNLKPALLPVSAQSRKMTVTSYKDIEPTLFSRKASPGTMVFANHSFKPGTGQFTASGKPIKPAKTVDAPFLLNREKQEFNIQYTDRLNGFICNQSSAITEDNLHNIWIATNVGIVKFDGYQYSLYNETNGLLSNSVVSVAFDKENRLWLATENGLYFMRNDSIFTLTSKDINFNTLKCHSIKTNNNNQVWVGTWENGAICISNNTIKLYNKENGLPFSNVFAAGVDAEENIFLLSLEKGIAVLEKNQSKLLFHTNRTTPENWFTSIAFSEEGTWIGGFKSGIIFLSKKDTLEYSLSGKYGERVYDIIKTNQGLWFSIYGKGLFFKGRNKFFLINAQNGLQSSSPYFLFRDSYENIWVSDLIRGFSRLSENSFYIREHSNPAIKNILGSILKANNDGWLFTMGGLVEKKGNMATRYTTVDEGGNAIFDIPGIGVLAKDGSIWMGSYGQGIVHAKGSTFTNYTFADYAKKRVVLSTILDKNEQLWFSTLVYGIIRYDGNKFWHYSKENGLLKDEAGKLYADNNGSVYSIFHNGVQRYTVDRIETLYVNNIPLTEKINDYCIASNGVHFIATENMGLLMLTTNKLFQFSTRNGLLSNNIISVMEDIHKKIWITTDKGIEYMVLDSTSIRTHQSFDKSNGSFLGDIPPPLKNSTGNLYWPANTPYDGKHIVFDSLFLREKNNPPYFSYDSIKIDKKNLVKDKYIAILPNQQLSIFYAVKFWGRENSISVKFELTSKNGETITKPIGRNGYVVIESIPPGNYQLFAVITHKQQVFKYPVINITINNFWYNHWLFRLCQFTILLMGVIAFFYQKNKKQNVQKLLLEKKVAEQTKEIKAEKEALFKTYTIIEKQNNERGVLLQELNHRVKNNLQFIITLLDMQVKTDLPEIAKTALSSASNRMNAMAMAHAMLYEKENLSQVSIRKYITELLSHLKSFAIHNRNDVAIELSIDDIHLQVKLAISLGMIISELVSNSFKHAFHKIMNPTITIKLTATDILHQFSLIFTDNGIGITDAKNTQKGMGNRLISIFSRELNGTYTIDSDNGYCFILLFTLPNDQVTNE